MITKEQLLKVENRLREIETSDENLELLEKAANYFYPMEVLVFGGYTWDKCEKLKQAIMLAFKDKEPCLYHGETDESDVDEIIKILS